MCFITAFPWTFCYWKKSKQSFTQSTGSTNNFHRFFVINIIIKKIHFFIIFKLYLPKFQTFKFWTKPNASVYNEVSKFLRFTSTNSLKEKTSLLTLGSPTHHLYAALSQKTLNSNKFGCMQQASLNWNFPLTTKLNFLFKFYICRVIFTQLSWTFTY